MSVSAPWSQSFAARLSLVANCRVVSPGACVSCLRQCLAYVVSTFGTKYAFIASPAFL